MEPRVGYSIATREAVVGVIVLAKRRMNAYACTQKKTHFWKPEGNVSVMARCSTAIRSPCLPFFWPLPDLTGQMSVPEMHNQNYSDRRKGSGVQSELQNVSDPKSPIMSVSDCFQGRLICRFVPRSRGDTSETRNTSLTRPNYKVLVKVDNRLTGCDSMIVHLLIPAV